MVDLFAPKIGHITLLLAQKTIQHKPGQTRLFKRLAQHSLLWLLTVLDSSRGYLKARLRLVRMAEDEQSLLVRDICEGFAFDWFHDGITYFST